MLQDLDEGNLQHRNPFKLCESEISATPRSSASMSSCSQLESALKVKLQCLKLFQARRPWAEGMSFEHSVAV